MQRPLDVILWVSAMSHKVLARSAVAALVVFVAACASPRPLAQPAIPAQFHGNWQGTFKLLPVKGTDAPKIDERDRTVHLRISITNADAQIYVNSKALDGVKVQTTWFDTNAVITVHRTGRDGDGVWVEMWSVAISVVDSRRLLATYQRQVNNKYLRRDDPDSVFAVIAYGILELS
jgi:hypothetical protein